MHNIFSFISPSSSSSFISFYFFTACACMFVHACVTISILRCETSATVQRTKQWRKKFRAYQRLFFSFFFFIVTLARTLVTARLNLTNKSVRRVSRTKKATFPENARGKNEGWLDISGEQ